MNPRQSLAFPILQLRGDQRIARNIRRSSQQLGTRALVELQVNLLLDELATGDFDLISDYIVQWANEGEQEKDGSTLMQVVKLIFENAKGEAGSSAVYARLCRRMMEHVSPNVQDEMSRNADGQPIRGGLLFRKYLFNQCQGGFERGWSAKQAMALAVSNGGNEVASGHEAAARARRLGLGLVRFIGELFKQRALTESIMHQCIRKLLSDVVKPEEEDIESLCELLWTVGRDLDNAKAQNHMDIYFERMQEMLGRSNVCSHVQHLLQDVIGLRQRHWQARPGAGPPSVSASLREQNNVQISEGTVKVKVQVSMTGRIVEGQFSSPEEDVPGMTAIGTPEGAMEARAERCIKMYLDTEDVEQAIDTCQNLQGEHWHIFVEKSIAAAFNGGTQSVNIIEKLFAAAHTRRICSPKILERGFLSAVESAAETSIDFPRAYEWLARLMHAAGLTKARVERMAERILVVGEPRVQPKHLLVYEFDKMIA